MTADSMPDIQLRVYQISIPVNIIAVENESATYKYLYTRQIQNDTFVLKTVFDSIYERRTFYQWFTSYIAQTIVPSPVGRCRVVVPAREFDMQGTLTRGIVETTSVTDVLWSMDLEFHGAQFSSSASYVNDSISSIYTNTSPSDTGTSQYFYPTANAFTGAPANAPTNEVPPTANDIQSLTSPSVKIYPTGSHRF